MFRKLLRHAIVLALVVAMPAVMNPTWSTTSSQATLMGRVLGEDARTPVVGAVVKIQSGVDGDILSSRPTNLDGTFQLRDLPPGDYGVVVETNEGAYKVHDNLALEEDTTRLVQVSIRKDATAAASGGGGVATGGGGGGGARAAAPLIGFAFIVVVGLLGSGGGNNQQRTSGDGGGVSPSVPGE